MKKLRIHCVVACAAALGAAGCNGGGGGPSSTFGLPAPSARHASVNTHGTITEYLIPRPPKAPVKTFPIGIAAGPDGNVWFAERGLGKIGTIDPKTFLITQYRLAGKARFPQNVTTGPDGNLWVAAGSLRTYRGESNLDDPYGEIFRMTPHGRVTGKFPLQMYSDPRSIVPGPDGRLWFTEFRGAIGRITTWGKLKEFRIPHSNPAFGIAAGPDGNLWYCELLNDKVVRITTSGEQMKVVFPRKSGPTHVVAGPDGYLYVTEKFSAQVAQLATDGTIVRQFQLSAGAYTEGVAVGSDGNLYVTEMGSGKIAEVTLPEGNVREFDIPTPNSRPWKIAAGPDGNIWFTESATGKIARLTI